MDINFHYYAVKVLAESAEFDGNSAQIIAEYSQFVDDHDPICKIFIKEENVPPFARYLCDHGVTPFLNEDIRSEDILKKSLMRDDIPSELYGEIYNNLFLEENANEKDAEYVLDESYWSIGWNRFTPVVTGFSGLKYALLILTSWQENTVIPFHFIPKISIKDLTGQKYRVNPYNHGDSNNILLDNLISQSICKNPKKEDLIRVGIIAHIFADTYSHQMFSGYNADENNCSLLSRKYNVEKYFPEDRLETDELLPSIGHMWVSTAPDESNVSFKIQFKSPAKVYERNNTIEFLTAAIRLLNYLREVKHLPPLTREDSQWVSLEAKLRKGFLINNPDGWRKEFPTIKFDYNKERIFPYNKGYTDWYTFPENYFWFNVIADDIRNKVIGNKPTR